MTPIVYYPRNNPTEIKEEPNNMNIFPPSPKNRTKAIRYVKAIRRRRNQSDYTAVREAAIGPFVIAPMFFIFMVTRTHDFSATSIALSIMCGAFGLFSIALGIRVLNLLELFPNTDLEDRDLSNHTTDDKSLNAGSEKPNKTMEPTGDTRAGDFD